MTKEHLGEKYYLDKEFPAALQIAHVDEGEAYEVDQAAIYLEVSGTFLFATASGCSCWDGEWYVVRYDTLEELFLDLGPEGESDQRHHPTFAGVFELLRQTNEWEASL